MSMKSKAKAAKKRERLKQLAAVEQQRVADNAVRLKTLTTSFARTKRTDKAVKEFTASKMPSYKVDTRKNVHHGEDRFTHKLTKPKQVLSPEMAKREQVAQERYHEMKKLVQPLYNKGGLQYPDAGTIEAGKKGELRRRS